ncbi:MAG: hypothetical protein ACR2PB_06940 [Desulfocapsaceae bacterium]
MIKKQGFLEILSGRNSIIGLTMNGVYEGEGCLVTSERSVVRLGGKMLMLPAAELNDIISSTTYNDEEELLYAFDEITKCFVVSFLETFQNDTALISKIVCQKQKIAEGRKEMSDTLNFLNSEHTYYQVSATINLAGVPLSPFFLLLPAFVLVCSDRFQKHDGQQEIQSSFQSVVENSEQSNLLPSHLTKLYEDESATSAGASVFLISRLLPSLQLELGNLLGGKVQIVEKGTAVTTTAELFGNIDRMAHQRTSLSISGPFPGEGWLIAEMADATRLGLLLTEGVHGGLIPLSLSNPFTADCQDGYNEICTIVIDTLSFVCQEISAGELFLVKATSFEYGDDSEDFYNPSSSSDLRYRLSSLEFTADGVKYGVLHLLLPATVHEYLKKEEPANIESAITRQEQESAANQMSGAAANKPNSSSRADSSPSILTIESTTSYASEVLNVLAAGGISGDSISLADELNKIDLESYQVILIVVEELDEIALGMVIKIKSISSVPLFVFASQWTQADVMKALRYGVDDILMLPVDSQELLQKIRGLESLPQ